MTRSPRYDPDENVSRHGATDPDKCEEMAYKSGWNLVRIEETADQILEVDCVFDGETEFPPSPYEHKREREE